MWGKYDRGRLDGSKEMGNEGVKNELGSHVIVPQRALNPAAKRGKGAKPHHWARKRRQRSSASACNQCKDGDGEELQNQKQNPE